MLEALERKFLNGILMWDLLFLEKKQDPDPVKQAKKRDRRVRKLMKKAYKIPFYRARFDACGLKPEDFKTADDLQKFPLLTKQELREWMDEECGKEKYKSYYFDTTSGSSGTPTKILYSPKEKAYNMANWMRILIKAGYNPYFGKTVSRMSAHSTSAGQKNLLQRMGILRREFVNQYEAESVVIDSINEKQPDLLYMNKTELMRIALYAQKNGIKVWHPKFFIPTGEKIDEQAFNLFRQVFGDGMIDSFGTAETGACMAKFPGFRYYKVHGDLFSIAIYDEAGNAAKSGRLVVTPLYKTDVPLINYIVGDGAASDVIDGRTVITEVTGRMNDFIQHADGSVTTFFMIAPIFAHASDVEQMRILQKSYTTLTIQLVSHNLVRSQSDIEHELTDQLLKKLKLPMEINYEWLDVIPPDKTGKLRLIVNDIHNV